MVYKARGREMVMNKAITMKKTIRDDDGRDLLRIASDTLPDAGHKAIEAFYAKTTAISSSPAKSCCCRAPNATFPTSASSPTARCGG